MTRSIQQFTGRRYYALVCVAVVLLQLTVSCGGNAKFCCLEYDRTSAQAMYCNNHSSAVGFFLTDPDPVLSETEWLDKFEALTQTFTSCTDPDCIDAAIAAQPDFVNFLVEYRTEHDDAEAELTRSYASVSLSASQKADLIRCGFRDAIDRSRKNLEEED